jgi:hypothetical protein
VAFKEFSQGNDNQITSTSATGDIEIRSPKGISLYPDSDGSGDDNIVWLRHGASLVFEGSIPDDYELKLEATVLTADRLITFQDEDGILALTSDVIDGDATTLLAATDYTDSEISSLTLYIDTQDSSILTQANAYADSLLTGGFDSTDYIGFDTSVGAPIYLEGRLFYDNVNKALSYYNESNQVTVNLGREVLVRVYNNTGSTITNGSAVFIDGSVMDIPSVALSKADTIVTSKVDGIVTQDIANGEIGYMTQLGTVRGISTILYSASDRLYLSDVLAGSYNTSPPAFPSYTVEVAVVTISDASNGEIEVNIHSHALESLQVDGQADFEAGLNAYANIDMLNNSIVNLADPVDDQDATTKIYVDSAVSTISGDISALTTDDIPEGSSNFYYSDTLARGAISVTGSGSYNSTTGVIDIQGGVTSVNTQTGDVVLTTTEITEGSNLYYTTARANTDFDTRLASKTTDNLAEGSNLYYTTARANTDFDTRLASKTTDNLAEGSNLYYTDARTNSAIDTRVDTAFVDALNVTAAAVQANSVALSTDTTGNYIATIAGTASEITVTGSGTENAAVILSLPNNMVIPQDLTITGDLTVQGTTIINDTNTVEVADPYITVGGINGLQFDDNKDRGVRFKWHDGTSDVTAGSFVIGQSYVITSIGTTDFTLIGATSNTVGEDFTATGVGSGTGTANNLVNTHVGFFGYDDNTQCFTYIPDATETGGVFSGTKGCLDVGSILVDTTVTGDLIGNADTATALETARTISLGGDIAGSVSFDGTSNVTITSTIQPNSVELGVDTFGPFVKNITVGTGLTITGNTGLESQVISLSHADTSTQPSVNNSEGTVIQDITLDDFGHITAISSLDLDSRYYTEAETNALLADKLDTTHDITLTFDGDVTGTGIITNMSNTTFSIYVNNDSHTHTIAKISGLQAALDAKIDVGGYAATAGASITSESWATARTITLDGDLSGSVNIDGSSNVMLTAAVTNDSHTHDGRYYTESEADARFLNASGDTMTGNFRFSDTGKAYFGAGDDLRIFHDGSNSYVKNLTNTLFVQSDSLILQSSTGETYLSGTLDGATELRYDNATKLTTTSSGIAITGTATATTFSGALNGNASTASKLATARTITLAGDLSGSSSFDGSANISITAVVANDSHDHTHLKVGGAIKATAVTGGINITGELIATGDVTAYSDRRFKHNIETIDNGLEKVLQLRGVTFEKDNRQGLGVIAQEVEEVIPEVVHTSEEGMKSVAYGNMVGVLIEAIKEQQKQIEELKAQINNLKEDK